MSSAAASFPPPSSAALSVSAALAATLRAAIVDAGGYIDFARFMQTVLYEPGLGYYSAGSTKLGAAGDFVTAPELGDWLGKAVAATLVRELDGITRPCVLELGAGTGRLAAAVLESLAACARNDVEYCILETSAELRERQRTLLAPFGDRVRWLERLPDSPLASAIVANEVLDALPVSRFVMRGGIALPLGVGLAGDAFTWREGPPSENLAAAVAAIERDLGRRLEEGYCSELRWQLAAWLTALKTSLSSGVVLLVDYGYPRAEYYRPERRDGTLRCHYRHRAHDDPFLWPGLQDITAWVDFSAVAAAARAADLSVAAFTTQAQYLLAELDGAPRLADLERATPQELAALKTLVLPGEMGEHFKVMLLAKDRAGATLPGRDFRGRL